MSTTTISTRGQVVIPAEIRKRAGLAAGDRLLVDFDPETGQITLRPSLTMQQIAAKASTWIIPGTPPLLDATAAFDTRPPRL
ncbi:MAG: AbrB/MazE/SpoVT family DNA-binding domain-containing protein [Propionibacteriaceae bacterium]|jgi:AbrB family looped-hinge helix DNA binding protein|nr:AbrB/MazE/SpoVT family DNA-binding domain-containing protein [Propionibacteriaceae bacterium]